MDTVRPIAAVVPAVMAGPTSRDRLEITGRETFSNNGPRPAPNRRTAHHRYRSVLARQTSKGKHVPTSVARDQRLDARDQGRGKAQRSFSQPFAHAPGHAPGHPAEYLADRKTVLVPGSGLGLARGIETTVWFTMQILSDGRRNPPKPQRRGRSLEVIASELAT